MKKLMKLLSSLTALTLVCVMLCSCSVFDDLIDHNNNIMISTDIADEYVTVEKYEFTASPFYTPFENKTSYNLLQSENERNLYQKLVDCAYSVYPEPYTDGYYNCKQAVLEGALINEAQIRVVIKAIYDDHPEIFWITSTFGYLIDKSNNRTVVQLHSDFSPENVALAVMEIGELVDTYLADTPEYLSDYQLEKMVHDDIIDMCSYNEEVAQAGDSDGYEIYYTVYGVLKEHLAVCEGYARTFELLLNLLGVECVGITGMAQGSEDSEEELHMWNAIKLDDLWYLVDVTWDDQNDDFQRHDYFNVNSDIMNLDHTPSKTCFELTDDQINGSETYAAVAMNMFIPECYDMKYNYIIVEYPHLEDYEAQDVIDGLYDTASAGEEYFEFYVDPGYLDLDEAITSLFSEQPQHFFNYVDTVNDRLDEYQIDTSSIGYVSDPVLNYIVVELHYL